MKKTKVDQVVVRPVLSPRSGLDYDAWFAEAYVHGCDYPVGIAFINLPHDNDEDVAPLIEQIHVVDQWQRRGVATQIVDACIRKWGFLLVTEPVTPAGRGFIRHMVRTRNLELF